MLSLGGVGGVAQRGRPQYTRTRELTFLIHSITTTGARIGMYCFESRAAERWGVTYSRSRHDDYWVQCAMLAANKPDLGQTHVDLGHRMDK